MLNSELSFTAMNSLYYIFICLLLTQFVQPKTENPWLIRATDFHDKLAKIVEASIAKHESIESIVSHAKGLNSYISDDQVLQMVSKVLSSERCYLTTPLIDFRYHNNDLPLFPYFDTPNLRKVTPDIIDRLKELNLRELDFEVCRHRLFNLIRFTDEELYILIAFTQPDLQEYNGQSLLPYRYCIDPQHQCHQVVNSLSPYKLIHSINTNEGRCQVRSIDVRDARRREDKVCDVDYVALSPAAGKCPELVEVVGTVASFAGVYSQSHVIKNGAPVYDGPGNTALSWSHGHWWLTMTTVSGVGESNGHGYLEASMECPGDVESPLVRGGSDVIIPGASITRIDVNYGLFAECAAEIRVSGLGSQLNGVYHRQELRMAVAGRPLYVKNDDHEVVIAWDGRWNNWWLTSRSLRGTNTGYAWFQHQDQDQDDYCPGRHEVVMRRSKTNEVIKTAKIKILDGTDNSPFCVDTKDLLRVGKHP